MPLPSGRCCFTRRCLRASVQGMNIALRKPMTLAEFLAWEERQELRYEFDGFHLVADGDPETA